MKTKRELLDWKEKRPNEYRAHRGAFSFAITPASDPALNRERFPFHIEVRWAMSGVYWGLSHDEALSAIRFWRSCRAQISDPSFAGSAVDLMQKAESRLLAVNLE